MRLRHAAGTKSMTVYEIVLRALQGRAVEGFGVNRTVWQAEAVALGLRGIEMPPGGINPATLTPLDPPAS